MLAGMGGGMGGRRGPTLAERSASAAVPSAGRHCWVLDPPGDPGRLPGLLLEWRREGSGWAGLVTYAAPAGQGTRLVQRWLPAGYLEPA